MNPVVFVTSFRPLQAVPQQQNIRYFRGFFEVWGLIKDTMSAERTYKFLLLLLLAPVIFGIPASLTNVIAYKYLAVEVELPPPWLEIVDFVMSFLAGVATVLMAKRSLALSGRLVGLLSVPTLSYAFIKCSFFQNELVAFMGFYCCREEAPGITSVLNVALNPLVPFWQMLVHN